MSDFTDALNKLLKYVFTENSNSRHATKVMMKEFTSPQIQMLSLDENKIFIERHKDLEYIYLFASGVAYVVNYTPDGRRIIADTFTEPQIFGLIEAINNDSQYRGTVITLSNSLIFKINKKFFLDAIYSDLQISSLIIHYLANLSIHAMKISENKSAKSPYDNLVIYLYNKTLGKQLPYRLKENKSFIADSLQINKRSLYRYLNQLNEQGIITRERQDILITQDHFKKIESLFNAVSEP